jgi:hypothetical protein
MAVTESRNWQRDEEETIRLLIRLLCTRNEPFTGCEWDVFHRPLLLLKTFAVWLYNCNHIPLQYVGTASKQLEASIKNRHHFNTFSYFLYLPIKVINYYELYKQMEDLLFHLLGPSQIHSCILVITVSRIVIYWHFKQTVCKDGCLLGCWAV